MRRQDGAGHLRAVSYAMWSTGRGVSDPTALLRAALITPKVKHHAAILDEAQLGQFLRDNDSYGVHAVTRYAMQLSPHLMARPSEFRMGAVG